MRVPYSGSTNYGVRRLEELGVRSIREPPGLCQRPWCQSESCMFRMSRPHKQVAWSLGRMSPGLCRVQGHNNVIDMIKPGRYEGERGPANVQSAMWNRDG